MSDTFISYARATGPEARRVADTIREFGHGVWRDDEQPPHRGYSDVIVERLEAATVVIAIWPADAVKSH